MPIPNDDTTLDQLADDYYDQGALSSANSVLGAGNPIGVSARLHAVSQRRLIRAIEQATAAQNRSAAAQEATNAHVVKLERIGIGLAVVGVLLAVVQVVVAVWEVARPDAFAG